MQYTVNGITYLREVFSSAPDQTIAVRLTANKRASISLTAQLRGERNGAMSNYATDYFKMDGLGNDGPIAMENPNLFSPFFMFINRHVYNY